MSARRRPPIARFLAGLAALLLLLAGLARATTALGAVELIYFEGTVQEDGVLLEWETATEFNNAGFSVYASDQGDEDDKYRQISPFIPAEGDGVTGAEYSYPHEEVSAGVTYYYKLLSLDSFGSGEFSDPVAVTVPADWGQPSPTPTLTPTETQPAGSSATPTPTPTATGEASPSPTSTGAVTRTSTPRPSSTPVRTNTPLPTPFRTSTPIPTGTVPPTATAPAATEAVSLLNSNVTRPPGEPTATLLPLPSVTIEFPRMVAAGGSGDAPDAAGEAGSSAAADEPAERRPNPARYLPLGIVGLLWVLLGAWLVYSIRRTLQ